MGYGTLEAPLIPPPSKRWRRAGAALAAGGAALCVAALLAAPRRPAQALAAKPKPVWVKGVSHPIDAAEAPFDALGVAPALPVAGARPRVDLRVDVDLSTGLCAEFDDDYSFPDASCDCGDARTQCRGNMERFPAYKDACFEAACGSENMAAFDAAPGSDKEKCAALTRGAWSMPCFWQAVKALPDLCGGSFAPVPPAGPARDAPDPYPDLDAFERYALGYAPGAAFTGPCDAHAYCLECLDDAYVGGVNPYCRAVFARYDGALRVSGGSHHTGFFADLDYWCQDGVLATLADAAAGMRLER